jgi:uncharacterized protein
VWFSTNCILGENTSNNNRSEKIMTESIPKIETLPTAFHIMLKPRGAICNLDCKYCYFLSKEKLYPNSHFRMDESLLKEYTRQYIAAQPGPEVTFAWQGGEPTLMGLDFFRRAVEYQREFCPPGVSIHNALQTNGVLLDEAWATFFHRHNFLVGVSLDGPQPLHNAYRVDKANRPTFDRVMTGIRLLQKHKVDFNILTTVHAANADHPLDVYRFLRDEVRTDFIQFIPIIERDNDTGFQEGERVTARSVTGKQYGEFLIAIFDEWAHRDVGQIFVQIFDVALAAWLGQPPGLCIFQPTCGQAMAMEHNGDLYACDHFVEPGYKLGNMLETPLPALVDSEQQRQFGRDKRDSLPRYCRDCEVRFICNGGCPKNRILTTPAGEPGLNYLCEGYKAFFTHIDAPMRFMANEIWHKRSPANIMAHLARQQSDFKQRLATARRNDPCPCGSGLKFKQCHGRR